MRSTDHLTRLFVLTVLAAATALLGSSGVRAAELLRWKFRAGDKFDCAIVQDMAMAMTSGTSGQMNTTMHQQMDMRWEVQKVSDDGNAVLNQSISRVRMAMNAPGGQGFEYDSQAKEPATGMAAMFAPMYAAMMQGQIEVTMTPSGKVIDVKIPDTMIEALKNLPGAAAMGDVATAEGFKKMFTQGSMLLPDGPPAPGEKWTTSMEMDNPMMGKMTVDTAYEYQGTKDVDGATCAVIRPTVTTKFEGKGTIPMTIKDQSSSGEILFNQDEGRLQSSLVTQKMTIDATVGDNQSIEQTIDQTTNLTLTPVKE